MKQEKKLGSATGRRAWRVFCVLGSGQVSGSCGHSHPTLVNALRCSYEPRAYQQDPEAKLRARPIQRARWARMKGRPDWHRYAKK